jgi:hypothetical protein
LPLEFGELSFTSPPLTEAKLLAQKKRRAKMKKGKQNEEKRPTKYTIDLPKVQQQK